ncbi:flagellar hook-length control protein FliK [Aidingimonas lacisalsi]|uniref:flagellar hook-length control protein FliK n=1 Tax=Aidingimonas lacisalsi TaxID=2604086 RepID=UPI0011D28376|nr:flagellar hook-length control protein FliK [Aidingimonas lacisalsi]
MSGITPILDTLLHQVLGKRADTPPPKVLNEPVQPMNPTEAPRALHSDSRLDTRQSQLAPLTGVPTRETPQGRTQSQPELPLASTTTQFSPAARSIADILFKFPAPPSVLMQSAPLMVSGNESAPASQVASTLQASINESGLFYESHLGRWFRGGLSRQALEREPQMLTTQTQRPSPGDFAALGTLRPLNAAQATPPAPLTPPDANTLTRLLPLLEPAASGQAVASGAGERASVTSGTVFSSASPAPPSTMASGQASLGQGGQPGQSHQAWSPGDVVIPETSSRSSGLLQEPINEALQGLVRHQLEMLVTPVLRWEGDVWSGIFMALMIHVPEPTDQRHRQGEEGASEDGDDAPPWRSDITLRLPNLGELKVSMRLAGERLAMTLASSSPDVVRSLESGQGGLRSRLEACGFDEVLLRTTLAEPEGGVE